MSNFKYIFSLFVIIISPNRINECYLSKIKQCNLLLWAIWHRLSTSGENLNYQFQFFFSLNNDNYYIEFTDNLKTFYVEFWYYLKVAVWLNDRKVNNCFWYFFMVCVSNFRLFAKVGIWSKRFTFHCIKSGIILLSQNSNKIYAIIFETWKTFIYCNLDQSLLITQKPIHSMFTGDLNINMMRF